MQVKVGIIQGVYRQLRYDTECVDNDGKSRLKFSADDAAYLLLFLDRYEDEIETIEFYANATPVPPSALAVIAQCKEIVGVEKCL